MSNINPQTDAAREAARRSDGKFGNQQHTESTVSLAAEQQVWDVSAPGQHLPVGHRMSPYELGLHTDDEGAVSFNLRVEFGEFTPGSELELDTAFDSIPEGCAPAGGIDSVPISAVDGDLIVKMTLPGVDSDMIGSDFDTQYQRGRQDRQSWLKRGHASAPLVDSKNLITDEDMYSLRQVPPMPQGTPEDVTINSWEDHEGDPIAELVQDGEVLARFRLGQDTDDFFLGDTWDEDEEPATEEPPQWLVQDQESYKEILYKVADNRHLLNDIVESRVLNTHGFDQRIDELARHGNPDANW